MSIETLRGPDFSTLLARAQARIGEDAVVLSARRVSADPDTGYELVAADPDSVSKVRPAAPRPAPAPAREPAATPAPALALEQASQGGPPVVIALVGPTGAGKTTTVAKLANHPQAFGGHAVGLLGLDTYRVGAIEQSRIYAELSRLPLEVVYEARELPRAMRRLAGCDVVLVDTAGRGPRSKGDSAATRAMLSGLEPLEVHLTLPAGLQPRLARRVVDDYRGHGLTHLLPTKLDEFPEDTSFFELSAACGLPVRWLTDGQEVPADLRLAQGHPPSVGTRSAAPRVAPRAWAEAGAA